MKQFADSLKSRGREDQTPPPPPYFESPPTAPSYQTGGGYGGSAGKGGHPMMGSNNYNYNPSYNNVNNYLPPPPPPPVHRQFPPKLHLYSVSGWGSHYVLGIHKDQPLYAVSTHTGWSGKPDVILHNGNSESAPPLATATRHTFSSSMTIGLPPLTDSPAAASSEEELHGGGCFSRTHSFEVEVGVGGGRMVRERFEWRSSRGAEVKDVGGSHRGHKLVRANGGEVVATYAEWSMSMTKQLGFQFVGSGAAGVLGERWAVMAVISALALHVQEKRRRAAASSSSGGA